MSEIGVKEHVIYALRNAAVKKWPFPHFYAENVFPAAFYTKFLAQLDAKKDFKSDGNRYHGRAFGDPNTVEGCEFMQTSEFLQTVAAIFMPEMQERFTGKKCVVYSDLRLVRDSGGYYIGPHTDAPWKLVSLLFYLPYTTMHADHGTSIYAPKDQTFRCPGGPHHNFEPFNRVFTAPFVPNACFGFWKTDNSFHGVETIPDFRRDVLLYNIYDQELYLQRHPPAAQKAES